MKGSTKHEWGVAVPSGKPSFMGHLYSRQNLSIVYPLTLAGLTTYFSNYTNVVALRLIHSCIHLELGRFSPQGLSYRSRTFENSRLIPLPVAFSTSTSYFSSYFHVHRGGFQWVFSSCRCRSWWRFTNHGGGFQAEQTVMVQEGQPWLDHVILVRYFI